MSEVRKKLETFGNTVIYIRYEEFKNVPIDIYIDNYTQIFNFGMKIISYMREQEHENWDVWYIDEWFILRKLLEELLKTGEATVKLFQERLFLGRNIDKQKIKELTSITTQLEGVIQKIPYVKKAKENIETIDDWVKSLRIYQLASPLSLETECYQTNDALYQDIRKIVLTKTSPTYKKIYAIRVSELLSSYESQSKLPGGINFLTEEADWKGLIELIKQPEFNFRIPGDYKKIIHDLEIKEKFEFEEWKNDIQLLVKEGKSR